jgi:hypothetical protein
MYCECKLSVGGTCRNAASTPEVVDYISQGCRKLMHVGHSSDLVQRALPLEFFPSSDWFFSLSWPSLPSSAFLFVPLLLFLTLTTVALAPRPRFATWPFATVQSVESLLMAYLLKIKWRSCQRCPNKSMKRIQWTANRNKTHLLRSRESIISHCFSRRAFVALLPAWLSSSSLWVSSLTFCSLTTRDSGATADSGMEVSMAAFCMSINRLLIFQTILTKRASA